MDEALRAQLTEAGVLSNNHNLHRFGGPTYAHDCEACLYLGSYNEADLYFCPSQTIPTVIARYSGESHDYASGELIGRSQAFPAATHRELRVAWLIARDCGLINDKED